MNIYEVNISSWKHKPEEKDFLMRWINVFDYE